MQTATTAGDGTYTLLNVAVGNGYVVSATKTGYQEGVATGVAVTSGATTSGVNIAVTARPVFAINDDFESDTAGAAPSGWTTVLLAGDTANVASGLSGATGKVVQIHRAAAVSNATGIYQNLSALSGTVTVQARVMTDVTTFWGLPYLFKTSNNGGAIVSGNTVAQLAFNSTANSGKITVYNGATSSQVGSIAANTWYTTKLVFNTATGKYDAYLNGTQIVSQFAFRNSATVLNEIEFFNNSSASGAGNAYVDSVRVFTGTAYATTDATLSGLAVSNCSIYPGYTKGITSYTATPSGTVTSVTVTPTTNSPFATVTVNGVSVGSGQASGSVTLTEGTNVITVVVTAEDGATTQTYTASLTQMTQGSITGKVTDVTTGNPLAGAILSATAGGPTYMATSGSDGKYSITGIPAGTGYAVTANMEGYQIATTNGLDVTAGAPTSGVDFALAVLTSKFDQTITFPTVTGAAFGTPVSLAATASSGLPVTYSVVSGPATVSGGVLTPTGVGTVTVTASQAGNGSYNPAPDVPQTFMIGQGTAAVTLSNLNQIYDGTPKNVTVATNPSGLAVNVTYDGSSTLPTVPGTYAVVATVVDSNYIGTASGALVVTKATATVTLSNLSCAYDGTPKTVTVSTNPTGLTTTVTYAGSSNAPSAMGSYAVVATVSDPYYTGTGTGTMIIASPGGLSYYLDSVNGGDGNDGLSAATAWQSLAKANGVPFAPGDHIYFATGSSWNGQFAPQGSGASGNPIVVDKYGAGARPLIAAAGNFGAALYLYNQQYWEISNLELTNTKLGAPADPSHLGDYRGVQITGKDAGVLNHIRLNALYVHDVTGWIHWIGGSTSDNAPGITFATGWDSSKRTAGILFETLQPGSTPAKTWFNDVTIENCVVQDCSFGGIIFKQWSGTVGWGERASETDSKFTPHTNIVIRGNYISQYNSDYACNTMYLTGVKNCLVENNICAGAGTSAIELYYTDQVTVQKNEIYGTVQKAGGADSNALDGDKASTATIFQYNYLHDCGDGILLCEISFGDAIVRYNVLRNHSRYYVNPHADKGTMQMYNNVFYNDRNATASFVQSSGGSSYLNDSNAFYQFKNNIFYTNATAGSTAVLGTGSGMTYDYNLYYSPTGKIAAVAGDAHKVTGDPLFAGPIPNQQGNANTGPFLALGGFQLSAGSPAINTGLSFANNGGTDILGQPIYNGLPDIGAFEYYPTLVAQMIGFPTIAGVIYGSPVTLGATATSGLTVSYTVDSGPATITGNTLVPTGVGAVTVRASQAGDGTYAAAADVSQTFTIAQAQATVTLGNLSQVYDGTPKSATATTSPPGLDMTITYGGSSAPPTAVGSYEVVATVSDPNYSGHASGVLIIQMPDAFTNFAADHGLDATTGAPQADPDGDGISNLMEFVLGGDPTVANRSILPTTALTTVGGQPALAFSYNVKTASAGLVAAVVEYSSDLATWTTAVNGQNGIRITTTNIDAGTDHVTVTIPTGGAKLFARLHLTY